MSAAYGSHSLAYGAPKWAVRLLAVCLALFLLLAPAASRQLTAIRVSAGEDLQVAIDAARPGDRVLLAPGARFVGNFVLPAHPGTNAFITIQTDARDLPGEGARTGPEYAGRLAIIQSPNNRPALRTAPRAHHWRLENLEFAANADGEGDIIALGDGSRAQRSLDDVPHTLVLDRLYIHGDPERGQKRGIALNSGATEIRGCHISGIKAVAVDSQAIAGWNGPGPYRIENNHLEAAGENVIFGGTDPPIPALVPSGIVVRRNTMTKPLEWREPLLAPPANVRVRNIDTDGSLEGGTYIYSVVAEGPAGRGATARSAPSEAATARLESTTGGVIDLEWSEVKGATGYRVSRRGDGPEMSWPVTDTRFRDTGAPGGPARSRGRPTTWLVKNLFELKNARDVVIDGNVFEYNWRSGQTGYAIVLKPTNQDGAAPWVTVEQVRFTNNIVRHVASAINVHGMDDRHRSARARGLHIANNLFVDVNHEAWGGAGDFLQIGGGPADVRVEHNTVLHTGRVIAAYAGRHGGAAIEPFVFRNNILRHNRYGVKGDSTAVGTATLEAFFPGAVFEGNVLAGGRESRYPPGNHFPSAEEFDALFVNPASGNYRLRPGSAFGGAGVDMDALERAQGKRKPS